VLDCAAIIAKEGKSFAWTGCLLPDLLDASKVFLWYEAGEEGTGVLNRLGGLGREERDGGRDVF
jgi:hypothetical protein